MRTPFFLPATCLLAAACASTPAVTPHVRVDPPPAADVEEPAGNALVSIAITRRPGALAVDGDLAEWGTFPPPAPKGGLTPPSRPPPKKASEQAPSSRLAVAMTSDGLALAGELSPSLAGGFWLTIVLDVPDVPPIGYWLPSGGISPIVCIGSEPGEGGVEDCEKLLADHEAFSEQHAARFQADYFIGPGGVSVSRAGATKKVDEAQAVFKPSGKGFHVELTLPPKALPRTYQAPLVTFTAHARGGSPEKPPVAPPPEEWSSLSPPEPVGFEPFAALRAKVFESVGTQMYYKPWSISYQPGEGLPLEDLTYDSSFSLLPTKHLLYSKQATLGDVEIGFVYTGSHPLGAGWTSVLTSLAGEPLHVVDVPGRDPHVVERDGELHVVSMATWESDDTPTSSALWSVYAVGPGALPREDVLEYAPLPDQWVAPLPTHSPDFSTLTITGSRWDPVTQLPGAPLEATWKWSPKTRIYEVKVKEGSAPPPKKPKKK